MAFPPAHLLIGAGFAEAARAAMPHPPSRWRAWLAAATLAVVPDFDFILGMATGSAYEYHGTFTHSLTATALVGALAALLAGRRWGIVALVGYGSHLLVDLLDDRGRTNVLLWWPFSHEQPFALAKIFPPIPFEVGKGLSGAVASLAYPHVYEALLLQTAIGAAGFGLLLLLAALLRRARPGVSPPRARGR